MYPYNHKKGQTIQTDAEGVSVDRSFLAHFKIAAASAIAASSVGILPFTNLSAAVQHVTAGLANPAVPRNVVIDGNVAGITTKVTVFGTNYAGAAISEELTANGTTAVAGAKAFKTITKVDLPVQTHTPVAQVETATAAGTITTAGNGKVTVTSGLFEADEVVAVPLLENDNANAIALAIRTALAANELIAEHFNVSGATDKIILTAKLPAANDTTLNIAIADDTAEGGCVGITAAASSANTTAGVVTDAISVGWGDIFGLPYKLDALEQVIVKLFNKSADTGTVVADNDELEKNTFDPNGTPDGAKDIDLYIIV